jgi:hypothetical protein
MDPETNTLEDILGAIGSAQLDLEAEEPEFDPGDQLADVIDRIEDKLNRNQNKTRANWFNRALSICREAAACWQVDPDRASDLLDQCRDLLEQGNKAHRRKTSFVVGPTGETETTKPTKGSSRTGDPLRGPPAGQP